MLHLLKRRIETHTLDSDVFTIQSVKGLEVSEYTLITNKKLLEQSRSGLSMLKLQQEKIMRLLIRVLHSNKERNLNILISRSLMTKDGNQMKIFSFKSMTSLELHSQEWIQEPKLQFLMMISQVKSDSRKIKLSKQLQPSNMLTLSLLERMDQMVK